MVIIDIQHMLGLRVNPQLTGQCLAHKAGIIVDLYMTALAASGNIYPIRSCFTVQDVACRFCLLGIWGIVSKYLG